MVLKQSASTSEFLIILKQSQKKEKKNKPKYKKNF